MTGAHPATDMAVFLHAGCGPKDKRHTTPVFARPEWRELRLDLDPAVQPDIEASMTDMSVLADASVDAAYSSHNIEHLYAHEVPVALAEFLRVLKPEGYLVVTCPDLQSVARLVAADKLVETAYQSPAGPVSPLDILYGFRPELARGNHFMAHRCGFTRRTLSATLHAAGFAGVAINHWGAPFFDLWAVASKSMRDEAAMLALAAAHFPVRGRPPAA